MPTPHEIDDATAEALLAGRTVTAELESLSAAVRAFRDMSMRAVPPNADLAAQMAAGTFTGAGERYRPVTDRVEDRRPLATIRMKWRTSRMAALEALAATAAKIAAMSVAAKAGAGVALAVAGVGAAGLTGVLPAAAQGQFESVVESVTPYEFPKSADEETGSDEQGTFGERVSEDARDGGVDGSEISEEARKLADQHRRGDAPSTTRPGGGKPAELPASGTVPGQSGGPPDARPTTVPAPPKS